MVIWKRVLRSPSSERFLGMREGLDAVAVDLHYLPDGKVAGTMVLLDGGGFTEKDIPQLLHSLDDDQLPGVDMGSGSLIFTVVMGKLVGNFEGGEEERGN